MNKPTGLSLDRPPHPTPSPQSHIRRSRKWRMPFSLLKCYDRVIERNYSPITLQSWLHEACGFRKKKKSGLM